MATICKAYSVGCDLCYELDHIPPHCVWTTCLLLVGSLRCIEMGWQSVLMGFLHTPPRIQKKASSFDFLRKTCSDIFPLPGWFSVSTWLWVIARSEAHCGFQILQEATPDLRCELGPLVAHHLLQQAEVPKDMVEHSFCEIKGNSGKGISHSDWENWSSTNQDDGMTVWFREICDEIKGRGMTRDPVVWVMAWVSLLENYAVPLLGHRWNRMICNC